LTFRVIAAFRAIPNVDEAAPINILEFPRKPTKAVGGITGDRYKPQFPINLQDVQTPNDLALEIPKLFRS
jgi:hypothetical protein